MPSLRFLPHALFCLLALGQPAHADSRDPVAADALFREARALLKEKKFEDACPKLAESYRLDPVAGTLFNLADCEEKQGKLASSLLRWQGLIDLLTASKKLTDARLPVARKKVEELGERVPRLTLKRKPGTTVEFVILRDGVELREASLGIPLPVDPGPHVVLVRAAYRHDREYKLSVKEKEALSLELEPGEKDGTDPKEVPPAASSAPPAASSAPPPPASAPPPPPPPTSAPPAASSISLKPPGPGRTLGFIAGGVGVAALVGAGITSGLMKGYKDTVSERCNAAARTCDQEGLAAASAGKSLGPVNLALWAVGAIGVGAGAYFILTSPTDKTTVSLAPDPKNPSLWLRGSF